MNCSRRNPKRSEQYVYHIATLVSFIERAGISCIKKEERISNSSIIRWTFFQFRSTSSRRDDLTDIDIVKKPGDREYFTANPLKKRCKKKYFQGIHDRFIRDPEFRIRIIENHRDEELCRQCGALQTPTNSQGNQQWAQSSSSWWSWKGSWWTAYSYVSHHGDEPSTD